MTQRCVFVTGATGYVGRALIARLVQRGHRVRALARAASVPLLPPGTSAVAGDALDAASYADAIAPADTLVHLVGTPHPNPRKARQFLDVDLASIREACAAARHARVAHLVYVSVAQPAPVMQAYIGTRREGEALVLATDIDSTVVRPWYIIGPGHRWPLLLTPLYALFERIPATRDSARRLGLVSLAQMVAALLFAIEHRPSGVRVVDVPGIRGCAP
ncbi:MAG TPA: NAD(P)H-binding protein [Casimicrobiaceae bacterium]|jgi:uncharacterized protein YbjT (DUF2867 family)